MLPRDSIEDLPERVKHRKDYSRVIAFVSRISSRTAYSHGNSPISSHYWIDAGRVIKEDENKGDAAATSSSNTVPGQQHRTTPSVFGRRFLLETKPRRSVHRNSSEETMYHALHRACIYVSLVVIILRKAGNTQQHQYLKPCPIIMQERSEDRHTHQSLLMISTCHQQTVQEHHFNQATAPGPLQNERTDRGGVVCHSGSAEGSAVFATLYQTSNTVFDLVDSAHPISVSGRNRSKSTRLRNHYRGTC